MSIVKKLRVDCKCGHSFFRDIVVQSFWKRLKDFCSRGIRCDKCKKYTTKVKEVEKYKKDKLSI